MDLTSGQLQVVRSGGLPSPAWTLSPKWKESPLASAHISSPAAPQMQHRVFMSSQSIDAMISKAESIKVSSCASAVLKLKSLRTLSRFRDSGCTRDIVASNTINAVNSVEAQERGWQAMRRASSNSRRFK